MHPEAMSNRLVSIIVNNFNYERFLGEAIASALSQTYEPKEVLVVDDGSTDGSLDVISSFGASVKPIFKTNEGQASTFNAGFEASKGEVIIFLDADDLLLPEAAMHAVRVLEEPDVVKVHWPMWEIDENGNNTRRFHKKSLIDGDYREEFIARGPIALSQSPTSGNAWPRWFLEKAMPLPEHEDRHGADGFLKKLCPIYGPIRRLEIPLGCYRLHAGNYGGGSGTFFKLRRSLRRYPAYCRLLEDHLRRTGVDADSAAWMGPGSSFEWLEMAVELFDELERLVPQDAEVVLIDNGKFGSELLPGRELRPLVRGSDRIWGSSPESDEQAVRELERAIDAGAQYLAFAFPAFWWRESFPHLLRQVESRFERLCANERLVLFDLEANATDGVEGGGR